MVVVGVFIAVIVVIVAFCIGYGIWWSSKKKEIEKNVRDRRENMTEEEKEREFEDYMYRYGIQKTVIIGQDSTKDVGSSVARGAVGGALFGVGGAIGGALSGKNKQSTTFLIIYNDGHRETMEVENGSELYDIYIQYLDV